MRIKLGYGLSASFYEIKHSKRKFIYLTVLPGRSIKNDSTINYLFLNLYHFFKKKKIKILLEKIYAPSFLRKNIVAIRNRQIEVLSEKTIIPFNYIGSIPCIGGKIAGVQVIGMIQNDQKTRVETIYFNESAIGRLVETDEFKGIYLSGISGLQRKYLARKQSLFIQAKHIVKQCQAIFSKQGMTASNIIQTWIYFPRILRWYKRFNKIRAKVFTECGLISRDATYLPASTGIQGKGRPREEIFLDLIAYTPGKKHANSISIMRSNRQGEAREYGATFSRGVEIKTDNLSSLHISGTASINLKGKTSYIGDEQGQIIETLINIGALLATKKANLRDIAITTAYCKNRITYKRFKEIIKYLGLDGIPFIPVYADICRSELLFEIDAIAVKHHSKI